MLIAIKLTNKEEDRPPESDKRMFKVSILWGSNKKDMVEAKVREFLNPEIDI